MKVETDWIDLQGYQRRVIMGNIKIKRSKIQKIIKDYVWLNPLEFIDANELTDKVWEYIEETVKKVKCLVTVRKE